MHVDHSLITVSKASMTQKRRDPGAQRALAAGQGFREADKEVPVVLQASAGRKEKIFQVVGEGWGKGK